MGKEKANRVDLTEAKRLLQQGITEFPWYRSKLYENDDGFSTVTLGDHEVNPNGTSHYESTIAELWDGNHLAEANADILVFITQNFHDMIDEIYELRKENSKLRAKVGKEETPQKIAESLMPGWKAVKRHAPLPDQEILVMQKDGMKKIVALDLKTRDILWRQE